MYQALNTRVILKYLEAWSSNDQIVIASDVSTTLLNLMAYSTEKLYGMKLDSLQLITAKDMDFSAEEIGVASVRSICTLKSVGVVNVSNIARTDVEQLQTRCAQFSKIFFWLGELFFD